MAERELDYTELVKQIRAVPLTWLPALFVTIVQECENREVFREGGIEVMLAKAKRQS